MKHLNGAILLAVAFVAACEKTNLTVDRAVDSKDLVDLKAGIWIDPNGCDHWIIDDGAEGYLSQRLSRDGKPVCSGGPSGYATGDYKTGGLKWDPV